MLRILAVLILAVLTMPAPHMSKLVHVKPGTLLVTAKPLPLDIQDRRRRHVGPLRFLGAWQLVSDHRAFGGISSMFARDDGSLIALSDSGILLGFDPLGHSTARPFIAPLPLRPAEKDWPLYKWDSESMAYDPATDRHWVGFELIQRICRYGPAFSRIEACVEPAAMQDWPYTGSAEAMVRLTDGRFLVFSEMGKAVSGPGLDLLLFAGDPTDAGTRPPARLSYLPPDGYLPTDAVQLDDKRLLVLNRKLGLDGFTASLALVKLPERMGTGTVLHAHEIARFVPPLLSDNFEAMALAHERGRRILWIASDDNHEFYQRSLLLKFALP